MGSWLTRSRWSICLHTHLTQNAPSLRVQPHRLRDGHGDFGASMLRKNLVGGCNADKSSIHKSVVTHYAATFNPRCSCIAFMFLSMPRRYWPVD